MFDQNMKEAQTGKVDIVDVDPDTLKLMLEFIYTGQVSTEHAYFLEILKTVSSQQVGDENYTAELLYAGDKYELDDLVNIFTLADDDEILAIFNIR